MATFTPLFDDITQKYGIVAAAVYGFIWRKCQTGQGVCNASLQTIADTLGVNRRTVINNIKTLTEENLITDMTPDIGTKPHKYVVNLIHQECETSELNSPASEIDSLELVKEIHQTSELNSPKYTYTDKDNIYTHPDPEPIAEIKTALATTTKTPLWAKTEEDYDQAAYIIFGYDCTSADVVSFGSWWNKKGHYKGKPALASLLQEFPNYLHAKNKPSANGHRAQDNSFSELLTKEVKDVIKR